MKQLESRAAVMTRRLAEQSPELFETTVRLFPWEFVTFAETYERKLVDWEDRSCHKTLTCVNHPKARWSTKNPWDRSIFPLKGINGGSGNFDEECSCAFSDLRVVIACN